MLSIREYLEAGETTISNLLFDHYQKIGLKDDEFLFLLQLFHLLHLINIKINSFHIIN